MKMLYMDTREDMPYRPTKPTKPTTVEELKLCAARIRLQLLELCTKEVIHIGGDLSIADVMTVLWLYQMKYDPSNPKWEKRDRFVLSKGHALPRLCGGAFRLKPSFAIMQRMERAFPCIPVP